MVRVVPGRTARGGASGMSGRILVLPLAIVAVDQVWDVVLAD
jgi:hypothetical protein